MSEDRKKIANGTTRNKERTKQRMIDAVGEVLKEKGYAGLTINNIVKRANVDRKLVAHYFGNVNHLIDEYLYQRDYWMTKVAPKLSAIISQAEEHREQVIVSLLHTLYDEISGSPDFQKILSWQVSEYQDSLRNLVESREDLANVFFKITDSDFEGTDINFRAMCAILISGIYYLILSANVNGAPFCEIDINTDEGRDAIKNSLSKMVSLIYNDIANKS
ncbi:MAG: TetR/AcrR family transcriptional regulator [Pedobacter sp.]|uniref:TetR/AcrR family transcriptional regulator n=1 Tax=Pedobacter sp. TaxID=1411316 RepID=UPI002806A30B|nr:TetR/AcrR family transcriptional regulator [Pedobacter sp.]MDQ8005644.1 TetR/AcrR family transcriptional regulator [Pedobacter sp.]